MNVLILSQHFWPETFRINEVATSLREAGAVVTTLTGKPNYPEGKIFQGYRAGGTMTEEHAGITVFRVPLLPRGRATGISLMLNYLSFIFCASTMGPWLLRGRPVDVIFVYGTSPILQAFAAIVLKFIKRCPVVLWVQDLWPQSLEATGYIRNRALLKTVEWLVRLIYAGSDLILVQSRAFVDETARLAARGKIRYCPNPGERAHDVPSAKSTSAIRLAPGFNVVFAGNIGSVQAIETIVEAATLLKGYSRARFVLVGSGSRSEWLTGEIRRRGLSNIELPGRFPAEAMPALFSQASALLVTLNSGPIFSLTVPSKVQAYLAAGRPIIASLDGEGARIVQEAGAGYCSPAEDAAALADAVRRAAELPEGERARMGSRGREYYEAHFAPARVAADLLAMFALVAKLAPPVAKAKEEVKT